MSADPSRDHLVDYWKSSHATPARRIWTPPGSDRLWPSRDCRRSGLAALKLPFANYGTRPTAAGRLSAKQTFNESGLIDDRGEQRQPFDQSATRPHWITSSARSSTDCGIVMPSAFAVFMLITRSNLVGCRTGKSAGLAPLRIRPVYTPAWRCTSGRLTP